MEFFCENPAAGHADDRIWKGYVKQLRRHGDTVEADISGKGSAMHVIIGRYEYGRYLCIPDCGVGSTLIPRLREGIAKLNICRFIAAPERGHQHFSVRLVRVFDIVKGFA